MTDPLDRAAAIPLGVGQDGKQPQLQHLRERGSGNIEGHQPGKLDQDVPGPIEGDVSCQGHRPGEWTIEHHLGAPVQPGHGRSGLTQGVEGLGVPRRRTGLGSAGL
jgi:hypothetical protein